MQCKAFCLCFASSRLDATHESRAKFSMKCFDIFGEMLFARAAFVCAAIACIDLEGIASG